MLLLCSTVSAQSEDYKSRLDSIIMYGVDNIPDRKVELSYTDDNAIAEDVYIWRDGWQLQYKTLTLRSANGTPVAYRYIDTDGAIYYEITIDYDGNGKVVARTKRYSESVNGRDEKEMYNYTSDGRIACITKYEEKSNQWTALTKDSTTYSADNMRSENILYWYKDGKWKPSKKVEQIFTSDGKLVTTAKYYFADGKWKGHDASRFEYNDSGFITKSYRTTKYDTDWVWDNERTRYYTYDSDNVLCQIKEWDKTPSGQKYYGTETFSYTPDESCGKVLMPDFSSWPDQDDFVLKHLEGHKQQILNKQLVSYRGLSLYTVAFHYSNEEDWESIKTSKRREPSKTYDSTPLKEVILY